MVVWIVARSYPTDILVMAKSLFSYVAAIISDGIILYEPWPKGTGLRKSPPPLKTWLVRLPEGNFDERRFVILLEAMTQSNPARCRRDSRAGRSNVLTS